MAEIIPPLNRQTLSRMTSGEKRFANQLKNLLEEDYLCWHDIPIGNRNRYPDFVILHPSRGLLIIEIKDWKPSTLKSINKHSVVINTDKGQVTKPNPIEQARQYAYETVNLLVKDPQLTQIHGNRQGSLVMPYGWGVVFSQVTRAQMASAIPESAREQILPDHLVMYKDDIADGVEAEGFQEMLWGMFNYQFGEKLSLPQIDRVRWHLFPDVRINSGQFDLLDPENTEESIQEALPDVIKIMDVQQEILARSLGEGHRVIHGVAGSGKTLILGYRCLHLAKLLSKPILVLCFNITLAAKLRNYINSRGIGNKVHVYHFHDWCGEQLRTYHVDVIKSEKQYWEDMTASVIDAVEKGHIPRGQYGALLIDEGHDFEPEWLKLVVQMVDPETNSILLLYDDAQSIYKRGKKLGFTLSSVGIEAKGRTTILKINYRNTQEILAFSYEFARHYFSAEDTDEDHIPIVEPQTAGAAGYKPVVRLFNSFDLEVEFAAKCLIKWHKNGVPWNQMALLYCKHEQGKAIHRQLAAEKIPCVWLGSRENKKSYSPDSDQVTILTVHSSKGLEFPAVIVLGIGGLDESEDDVQKNAKLLYVGMTRAQEKLLITTSQSNQFSRTLLELGN